MRKRKRWIIGLTVVFLAACVALLQMASQRPYRFLAGSTILMYHAGPDMTAIVFESERRLEDLKASADVELTQRGWRKDFAIYLGSSSEFVTHVGAPQYSYVKPSPGAPDGAEFLTFSTDHLGRTRLGFSKRATVSDRLRTWLFNLKNR